MKTKLLLFLCASGLLLTGCEPCKHYSRVNVAVFSPGTLARKPYGSIANVWRDPAEITQPHRIIAMLSCEASTGDEAAILNAMLYRTARLGGDGLLLGGPRVGAEDLSGAAGMRIDLRTGWASFVGSGNSNRRAYRSQVIKFQ